MSVETRATIGGFTNPVFQAQSVFSRLMHGMAKPGTRQSIEINVDAPDNMPSVSAAIALTLCDTDTPVWLAPQLRESRWSESWLRFHTGCPFLNDVRDARFVILGEQSPWPALSSLAQGSDEYPDRSATVLAPVHGFDGPRCLLLQGPGIDGHQRIRPRNLPDDFLDAWTLNTHRFPCGIDLILVSSDEFVCLPRSTRISPEDSASCM